jgi:hypothetical protein
MTKLDQLEKLLREATYPWSYKEWDELINATDAELANMLRNNAASLLKVIRAVERADDEGYYIPHFITEALDEFNRSEG